MNALVLEATTPFLCNTRFTLPLETTMFHHLLYILILRLVSRTDTNKKQYHLYQSALSRGVYTKRYPGNTETVAFHLSFLSFFQLKCNLHKAVYSEG